MKALNDQKIEFLAGLNCSIDLVYMCDGGNFETVDELRDMIEDNDGFNVDVIYYSEAIKFLQEHDPSLRESLEIASEFEYELNSLSSEILASLLASQKAREEFQGLEDEIAEFLNGLEEEEE